MAMLLKKVWVSMSTTRSNSNLFPFQKSSRDADIFHQSSTGAFDQLPADIFLQILKYLEPKEAARMRLVCKTWKLFVSDNRLWIFFFHNGKEPWDSVVFAETHLRLGCPLRCIPTLFPNIHLWELIALFEAVGLNLLLLGNLIPWNSYCKFGGLT